MAYQSTSDDVAYLQQLAANNAAQNTATAQNTSNADANSGYVSTPDDIQHLQQLAQPQQAPQQAHSSYFPQLLSDTGSLAKSAVTNLVPNLTAGNLNVAQNINKWLTGGVNDIYSGGTIGAINQTLINKGSPLANLHPQLLQPAQTYDWNQYVGAPKVDPNASWFNTLTNPDAIEQGTGGYAGFGALAGETAVGEGLASLGEDLGSAALGKAASYINRSPVVSNVLNQMPAGALYGSTQNPQSPLMGATLGGILAAASTAAPQLAGKLITGIRGGQNTINSLGNSVLDYVQGQAGKGAALSPEDTAKNMQMNYSGLLPGIGPDFGKAVNNTTLKGVYGGLQYSPFSGVAKNTNLLANNLINNKIDAVQNQIQQQLQDETSQTLASQLGVVGDQQAQHAAAIGQGPAILKSLVPKDADSTQLNQINADALRNVYSNNKAVAGQKYDALKQYDDTRLDQFGGTEQYPQYSTAANELLAQKQNLKNLFDSSSDIGGKLNDEVEKADAFLNNNETYGATLGDVRTRTQQLGKLAQQLYSGGNNDQARLIMGLKNGLESDTGNILNNNDMANVGNMWNDATSYYRKNITNFWDNPVIQKTVQKTVGAEPFVPDGTTLAMALHNPNYKSILAQIPNQNQNMLLAQILTQNKGNFNLRPKQLSNTYANLDQTVKNAVASYNPTANQTFNQLPTLLDNSSRLADARDSLSQQLEKTNKGNQDAVEKLSAKLQELQAQKYGTDNAGSATSKVVGNAVKGGALLGAGLAGHLGTALGAGVPTIIFNRNLARALQNPALIQAYINRARLPVAQSAPGAYNAIPYGVMPQIQNMGNQ